MVGNLHADLMKGLRLSEHMAVAGGARYNASTACVMDLLDVSLEFFFTADVILASSGVYKTNAISAVKKFLSFCFR